MNNELKIPKRIRNHVNPLSIFHINEIKPWENSKDIIIDIGSYRGEFGEKMLKKYREERNFILFEIRKPFYEFLKEKFKENKNVQVFDGDAGKSLKSMIDTMHKNGHKIDKIFINFPDPGFKKKHHKRRFLNKDILEDFSEVLTMDEKIIFQTDQKQLFKDTIKVIKENGNFKIKKFKNALDGVETYGEEMKVKEGNKIYRMEIIKKNQEKKWWKIF